MQAISKNQRKYLREREKRLRFLRRTATASFNRADVQHLLTNCKCNGKIQQPSLAPITMRVVDWGNDYD